MNQEDKEEFLAVFKICDYDGSGLISPKELHEVLMLLGEQFTLEELQDVIRDADLDGNEEISYDEFVKIMKSF